MCLRRVQQHGSTETTKSSGGSTKSVRASLESRARFTADSGTNLRALRLHSSLPAKNGERVSTLLTEDANDRQVNCLDRAADVVAGMSAEERKRSELVFLIDKRAGAEGNSGHVVVRQGDEVLDPSTGLRYANTDEYLRDNPHYEEVGALGAEDAQRVFSTPPGSPDRARALREANAPESIQSMALADGGVKDDLKLINDKLSYAWNDWAITDGNIGEVNKRIGEIVDDPNRDVNEVINGMTDEQLERWKDNMDDKDVQPMLDKLATELDGKNAARLAKYFDVEKVGDAVAAHAPAKTKADFVQALSEKISGEEDTDIDALPGAVTHESSYGNAEARAAGKVLASMADDMPAAEADFNRAVGALAGAGKLDDVVKASMGRHESSSNAIGSMGTGSNTTFSPETLLKIMDAATKSNDTTVKSQVLQAVGQTIEDWGLHASDLLQLGPVGTAMGRLMTENADTGAIVADLRTSDPKGTALSATFKTLMVNGESEELAKKIGEGTKATGSSADVGYLVGSLLVATEQLKGEIDDQKTAENYAIGLSALALGGTNIVVGTLIGLGALVGSTSYNTGADAKTALDEARARIRQGVAVNEDSTYFDEANKVADLNGVPRLVP